MIVAKGFIQAIQIITTTAPVIIPDKAPACDKPFQYNEKITKGLKAAPNPAQAFPTKFKIVSFGDQAIQIATIATNNTDNLPTRTNSFSCSLALSSPSKLAFCLNV